MLSPNIDDDELARYLSTPPEPTKPKDTLAWWHAHRKLYPCLSRMALDYLSIPGTSNLLSVVCLLVFVLTLLKQRHQWMLKGRSAVAAGC